MMHQRIIAGTRCVCGGKSACDPDRDTGRHPWPAPSFAFYPDLMDWRFNPGTIVAMETTLTHVAFAGPRQIAAGALTDVLPVLKQRFDQDTSDMVLVFEVETGRQVEFDLRGSPREVLERAVPPAAQGPGRPRLGVVSREVSLLPRHWDWLEEQPSGASAALRRMVEQAIKHEPGKEHARRIRAALSRFLTAIAGDRPGFEDACRALFAGDTLRFQTVVEKWPRDVREYAVGQARAAAEAEG